MLTVEYVFQPEQAPAVVAALRDIKTRPITANQPASGSPTTGLPTSAAPASVNSTAPVGANRSNALGCLALIALVVVAWAIFGGGNSGNSVSATVAPAAPVEVSHLTGSFVRWEPVDEANGYAYFTVTNSGTTTETATCTVRVENDFGNFGFDILVGEPVGPGETISGRLPLSVGEGSFLINQGEVNNC
ncbi:MAG: hypothetical protein Q7S35_04995 [Candidatus Limnocylindrales bacterium]|nr:hypothetical protein [Candidatus Limnocylindrales bacterium]